MNNTKYNILRKETDKAGNLRCWVDIGDGETQIFKFKENFDKMIIKKLVDRLTDKKQDINWQLEEINNQIDFLNKIKSQLELEK